METNEQRSSRLEADRVRKARARKNETPKQYRERLQKNSIRNSHTKSCESEENRSKRLECQRLCTSISRLNLLRETQAEYNRIAFRYNANSDYSNHPNISIGQMNKECNYCHAFRFKNESIHICCANGKVKLPEIDPPPEILSSLVSGTTNESKHFLSNIRQYNTAFQMTSFGINSIIKENYMPTFKVQGQIYHRIGSLLPSNNSDLKFLQIYFMGNKDEKISHRLKISSSTKPEIIEALQTIFEENNQLIHLFQTALDHMPNDEYSIVIKADKCPAGNIFI